MGKDEVKKQFTIDLNINNKDAKKKIEATVSEFKNALTKIGTAADKMQVFKNLTGYLAEVDKQLDVFAKKHGGGAFAQIFGMLDDDLKAQMQGVLDESLDKVSKFNALRDRFAKAKTGELSKDDKKALIADTKALLSAANIDFKIDGRQGIDKQFKAAEQALDSFEMHWDSMRAKINKGFSFEGVTPEIENKISDPLADESERIKKEVKEIEDSKKRFQKAQKEFNKIKGNKSGAKISKDYDIDITPENVKALALEHNKLQVELNETKAGTIEYYNTLEKLATVSLKLKKAFGVINSDENLIQQFKNDKENTIPGESTAYGMASRMSSKAGNIESKVLADAALKGFDALKQRASLTSDQVEKSMNKIKTSFKDAFDKTKLFQDSGKGEKAAEQARNQLAEDLKEINKEFALGKDKSDIETMVDALHTDIMKKDDITLSGAFEKLCNTLGIEIPQAAAKAEAAIEDVNKASKAADATPGTPKATVGDGSSTEEIQNLEKLRAKIAEVEAAVKQKTAAFEAEKTEVSSAVAAEMSDLDNLILKLREVARNANINLNINHNGDGLADSSKAIEESFTPTAMDVNEAKKLINDTIGEDVIKAWYVDQDPKARTTIGSALASNNNLRNAAYNIAWDTYKRTTDPDISIGDFLYTDMPVYRGKKKRGSYDKNEYLSFSSSIDTAKQFGEVVETLIKPIDTLGNAYTGNAPQLIGENEFFISKQNLDSRNEIKDWLGVFDQQFLKEAQEVANYMKNGYSADDLRQVLSRNKSADDVEKLIIKARELNGEIVEQTASIDKVNNNLKEQASAQQKVNAESKKEPEGQIVSDVVQAEKEHKQVVEKTENALEEQLSTKKQIANIDEDSHKNTSTPLQSKDTDDDSRDDNKASNALNDNIDALKAAISELTTVIKTSKDNSPQDEKAKYALDSTVDVVNTTLTNILSVLRADKVDNSADDALTSTLKTFTAELSNLTKRLTSGVDSDQKDTDARDDDKTAQILSSLTTIHKLLAGMSSVIVGIEQRMIKIDVDENNNKNETLSEIIGPLQTLTDAVKVLTDAIRLDGEENKISNTDKKLDTTDTAHPTSDYALESTLTTTNSILNNILAAVRDDSELSNLATSLKAVVDSLKTKANEIATDKKKLEVSEAGKRIANNYNELVSVTGTAFDSDTQFEVSKMKVVEGELIEVQGAVKTTEGVWKGFVAQIDSSNNVVMRSVGAQSKLANSLNQTELAAKGAENAAKSQETSVPGLDRARKELESLQKELKNADYASDALRHRVENLDASLEKIDSPEGLSKWFDRFEGTKKVLAKQKVAGLTNAQNSALKGLDFDVNSADITSDQQKVADAYNEVTRQIEKYEMAVKNGEAADLSKVNAALLQLEKRIRDYKAINNLLDTKSSGRTYGANKVITEQGKYEQLMSDIGAQSQTLNVGASEEFQTKLDKYKQSYQELIAMRNKFAQSDGKLTVEQKANFDILQKSVSKAHKELEAMLIDAVKLHKEGSVVKNVDSGVMGTAPDRQRALQSFADEVYKADVVTQKFTKDCSKMFLTVNQGDGTMRNITVEFNKLGTQIIATEGATERYYSKFSLTMQHVASKVKSYWVYAISSMGVEEVFQQFRVGMTYVKDIDTALTELKKVTAATSDEYKEFLGTMSQTASVVGGTTRDLTNMAADWARLGYSMEESAKLAENTAVLLNVSEFEDAASATEAMISTMQGFGYAAKESSNVIDILNEVGNNYAVSSDGIATALQTSASALMEGGNSMEQASAMIAAANKVVQDPAQIGNALRTISLRLRGTSLEELEELGEDTDGMVEGISKMQEKIKAASGVDIIGDDGAYKSTYQILLEIAKVWDDLSDMNQAGLLELMAGKNRANVLAAMLDNVEDLEGAYESAMDSAGSAAHENEAYLDSIDGKLAILKNSYQTLWANAVDSEAVKFFLDLANTILKVVDAVGGLETAIAGVLMYLQFSSKKKFDIGSLLGINFTQDGLKVGKDGLTGMISNWFGGKKGKKGKVDLGIDTTKIQKDIDVVTQKLNSARKAYNDAITAPTSNTNHVVIDQAAQKVSHYEKELENLKKTQGGTSNGTTVFVNSQKKAGDAMDKGAKSAKGAALAQGLLNAALSFGIAMVFTALISTVHKLTNAYDDMVKRANEAVDVYEDATNKLRDQKKTLDELSDTYDELSHGVDFTTNENISLTDEQYQRYLETCNEIADMYPTLVQGFDEQGNAILNLKGNTEGLTDAYKSAAQAARQAALESSQDIFVSFKETYDDSAISFADFANNTSLKTQEKIATKLLEFSDRPESLKQYVNENQMNGNSTAIETTLSNIGTSVADLTSKDWRTAQVAAGKVVAFISTTKNKINAETSKIKTLLDAYLGEDTDYSHLGERSQGIIKQIISGLDASYFAKFDSADTLYADIKAKIVDTFHHPDVRSAMAEFSELQLNLDESKISYDDYESSLSNIFSRLEGIVDKDILSEIKLSLGVDEEHLNTQYNHINSLLSDRLKDELNKGVGVEAKIKSLNLEDFKIAGSLEVDPGTIKSWDDLIIKIKEAKLSATEDFKLSSYADDVADIHTAISTYEEALNKLNAGTFKIADFAELVKTFPELAEGVDITSDSFEGLSTNLIQAIKSSPKALVKDLKDLRDRLEETGRSTQSIDALIQSLESMPDNVVQDLGREFGTLADEIDRAARAKNNLDLALQEEDTGYMTRAEAINAMKEHMAKGEIGSESRLWDIATQFGFTYDSSKTINENADALAKFVRVREDWYDRNDDGEYTFESIENFIEYVEGKDKVLKKYGAKWSYENGELDIDLDNVHWEEFAKEIGTTEEEFTDLMKQIGIYFGIDWQDNDDQINHLKEIAKSSDDAATKISKYGKAMNDYYGQNSDTDLSDMPVIDDSKLSKAGWDEQIEKSDFETGDTFFSQTYTDKKTGMSVVLTPVVETPTGTVIKTPEELEAYAQQLFKGEEIDAGVKLATFTGENAEKEAETWVNSVKTALKGYEGIQDPLGIATTFAQSGASALKDINKVKDALKYSDGQFVGIDEPVLREKMKQAGYAAEAIDDVIERLKILDSEAFLGHDKLDLFDDDFNVKLDDGIKGLSEIKQIKDSFSKGKGGTIVVDTESLTSTLSSLGYTQKEIDKLIKKIKEYDDVVAMSVKTDPLGLEGAKFSIDKAVSALDTLGIKYQETSDIMGKNKKINIDIKSMHSVLSEKGWTKENISAYLKTLAGNEVFTLDGKVGMSSEEIDAVIEKIDKEVPTTAKTKYEVTGTGSSTLKSISRYWDTIPKEKTTKYTIKKTTIETTKSGGFWSNLFGGGKSNESVVDGTAHSRGTAWNAKYGSAFAGGNWGAKDNETALVGELGPEMIVRGNRWFTVGDNGAEFAHIQKGDIIFNHKQTEELLSNGYITSRGKAFAEGTAYAKTSGKRKKYTFSYDSDSGSVKTSSKNTGNSSSGGNSSNKNSTKDTQDAFEELFDWFEVRIEELQEDLDLLAAKLENAVSLSGKNNIIDSMIKKNKQELGALDKGYKLYSGYANKLLKKIPKAYRAEAKDGKIAIEKFYGKVDEKTLEAIKNYREWAQKAADLKVQIQEIRREITELSKQKLDNIIELFDNVESVQDARQSHYVDMAEYRDDKGWINSDKYYEQAIREEKNKRASNIQERNRLQAELDKAVKEGRIKVGSAEWYDTVNAIHEVDSAIDENNANIEDYQNRINEINFDNFEKKLYRVSRLAEETQNLIDVLANKPSVDVDDEGNVSFTDEGIAQIGLYAQKIENAKKQSEMYAQQIDELNAMYARGEISYDEYLEKLDEYKDGQYEAIQAEQDAKDAIIELEKARVDEIKNGIDKQIEAYSELIDKKKEELDAEKDLYDFQRQTMDQAKNIADIQRQLAAISGDNSASANAQRKKLEAELAQAKQEQADSFYDRSVSNAQEALDNELELFTELREKEKENWDKWLENTDAVFAHAMETVTSSGETIKDTIKDVAEEWDLQIADNIIQPWNNATTALQNTEKRLDGIVKKFDDAAAAADKYATQQIRDQKEQNDDIADDRQDPVKGLKVTAKAGTAVYDKNGNVIKTLGKNTTYTAGKTDPKTGRTQVIDSKGNVVGWVNSSSLDVDKNSQFKKGQEINAQNAPLYSSKTDSSGEYQGMTRYIVQSVDKKTGRVKAKSVNKNSKGKYVTGWFKMADVVITKQAPKTNTTTTNTNTTTTTTTTSGTKYYKKYTGKSGSIVDALKAIGVNSSFDNRKKIAKANGISNYSGTGTQNTKLLNLLKKGKLKKYAVGSKNIPNDQFALLHELGEELVLHAGANGKLEYLTKGSGVVPADLTSNLMEWGKLDPQSMLDQNRPSVGISPEVHATEINLNIQYGDMLKIENFKGDNPEDIAKIVAKQFEKHTKDLNSALRKYVR